MQLDLTIDETNVILKALAKQPFEEVTGLISKIHGQAQAQLKPAEPEVSDIQVVS